jgi:hypothetical protein
LQVSLRRLKETIREEMRKQKSSFSGEFAQVKSEYLEFSACPFFPESHGYILMNM